jgi:hypothetical protein
MDDIVGVYSFICLFVYSLISLLKIELIDFISTLSSNTVVFVL